MDINTLVDIVSNNIFPIAVTIYLLYERTQTTKENNKLLENLTTSINLLNERLNYILPKKEE